MGIGDQEVGLASYIPTHRDEAAMDGAPDILWPVEEEQRRRPGLACDVSRWLRKSGCVYVECLSGGSLYTFGYTGAQWVGE